VSSVRGGTGGLFFDGTNDYVTFGAATNINNLGVTNFTVECWFKRQGPGKRSNTGNGGINAIPLVTKGMAEADGNRQDCNWFFGIGTNDVGEPVLAADFEDMNTGLNHPVRGQTLLSSNVWQHAAVTYSVAGSNWVLYVNGAQDLSSNITGPSGITNFNMLLPRYDSTQHGALATSLLSTGNTNASSGVFAGAMDEVRIWNYARSAQEISDNYNLQITTATGLIGRWSLNEGVGITITNSVGGGVNGRLTNGPAWTNGYFAVIFPPQVSITSPANGSTAIGDWLALSATASPSTGATITNVQFFAGASKIGDDASVPYGLNWCDVAAGTYSLTAVVMDDSGAVATSSIVSVTLSAPAAAAALEFDGTNDYVTFGAAPELGLSTFTIECWFKRTGTGKATTTGTGGVTNAVPLVSKGRGEAEGSNVDMNWFLGISTNANVLAADFEEGATGTSPGLNHPVFGSTPVQSEVWYHAAATYDGTNWALYLDGSVEATLAVGQPPRSDSIQHAALASALTSSGSSSGNFQGRLDEVRIWNYARSAQQIADNYNLAITNQAGLIARYALNEGSGAEIRNAVCGGINGTLLNGPVWSTDSFDANIPPSVAITNPVSNATVSATNVTIEAAASDSDGSVANVQFYNGETPLGNDTTEPYSLVWSDVGPGTYALKAVATDNLGLSTTSAVVNVVVTPPVGVGGLYFDGKNDYVTFGAAAGLGVTNFTIECWFKLQGPGKRANTGAGGIFALPLVTRGMAENEVATTNMNYFLGVGTNNSGQTVLAADFEDMNNGLNHPVRGTGIVASNAWQHAAVTYDVGGSNWVLYLNGVQDFSTNLTGITNDLMLLPRFDSVQHAAIGGSLRTGGVTNSDSGFLAGTLDEVRIWNYPRSAQQIADNYQAQIPGGAGLIARWSLDDGTGLVATNSGNSGVDGILTNGPIWVEGYPFTAAPAIIDEPDSTNASCGDNVTFTVGASGSGTLIYQWYFENLPVTNETNASLALINVNDADAGTYQVTVQNGSGSVTSAPAVLAIIDTTAPVVVSFPTNTTLNANVSCQATIPDLASQVVANDSCSAVTVTQLPVAGASVGVGVYPVFITVSDAATNQTLCNATVTVVDITVPNISVCATNISISADTNCQATIPDLTSQIVANDSCGSVTISQSPLAGTIVGSGDHLVTFTATDGATNQATCYATVTVVDATAPNISVCATNMTLAADTNCQATIPDVTSQIVAGDACSSVDVAQSPVAGTVVGLGDTLVTITITDAATNQAACSATITVIDSSAPMITSDPQSSTNVVTTTATFNISATSCSQITYQWILGTNSLAAETNSTLIITNVQLSDAGDYTVVLANGAGSVTSGVAVLTVQLPAAPTLNTGPTILPNGHFHAGFTGSPNMAYTIEYADLVTGPWQPLTNITSDINGLLEIEDFTSPLPDARYYRCVFP
jgi:hypothetical protein